MKNYLKLNQLGSSGMSLVELLVALGVGTIAIGAFTFIVINSHKTETLMNVKQDNRDAVEELGQIVKSTSCGIAQLIDLQNAGVNKMISLSSTSFFDKSATSIPGSVSGNFNEIPLNGGASDGLVSNRMNFVTGAAYGKLKVRDIRIMPRQIPTASGNSFSYEFISKDSVRAQIYMEFENLTGAKEAKRLTAKYPLVLFLDSAHANIINCSSLEYLTNNELVCENFGGTWDQTTLTCSLDTVTTSPGQKNFCTVDDSCQAAGQYLIQ